MSLERRVMAFAGVMVVISALLVLLHHRYWSFFTLFIGANMFQSSFTGFCPAAIVMRKLGARSEAELAAANQATERDE